MKKWVQLMCARCYTPMGRVAPYRGWRETPHGKRVLNGEAWSLDWWDMLAEGPGVRITNYNFDFSVQSKCVGCGFDFRCRIDRFGPAWLEALQNEGRLFIPF